MFPPVCEVCVYDLGVSEVVGLFCVVSLLTLDDDVL
jgi:hypothetical protein